jgi:hypothetical protein
VVVPTVLDPAHASFRFDIMSRRARLNNRAVEVFRNFLEILLGWLAPSMILCFPDRRTSLPVYHHIGSGAPMLKPQQFELLRFSNPKTRLSQMIDKS